jgi:hexosaminidase
MKSSFRGLLASVGVWAVFSGAMPVRAEDLCLIPWPQSVEMGAGDLALVATGRIIPKEPVLMPLAEVFAGEFKAVSGVVLPVCAGWATANAPAAATEGPGDIVLTLDPKQAAGGYLLTVTDRVLVQGCDYKGAGAGTATLLQALKVKDRGAVTLPRMKIRDFPQADYCGVMLDVTRRDYPIDQIRQALTLCRFYKIRYLQLHLTDNEAWTFPSTRYPSLGTRNASAAEGEKPARRYTLAELKELVAYADALGVTLVPEIALPGRSGALTRTLPEVFGPDIGMVNIAREAVYPVLDTLLAEVADVFASSPYLHIGGIEADFTKWAELPEAKPYVEKTGLQPPQILEKFFARMNDSVRKLGKRTVVWEGFERNEMCKVPTNVIVECLDGQSYRADDLVRDGYSIINGTTPSGQDSWNSWNLYQFDGINLATNAAVVGATWAIWDGGSYTTLDLMRRAGRWNEHVWNTSTNRPSAELNRSLEHTDRVADRFLFRLGSNLLGPYVTSAATFGGSSRLELWPHAKDEIVRYTLDGTEPTAASPACRDFIELEKTTVVKARVFGDDGKAAGLTWSRTYTLQPR